MTSKFFEKTVRWNVERNGTKVALPYFYYDNLSMTAIYTAATAQVRKLIPHPDLHLLEWVPGRCLVAFTAFEYRKVDDLPYNEVSIAFPISYPKKKIPLLPALKTFASNVYDVYVWQLPVTTEAARAGGVDLFNYPKFLADIRFIKESGLVTCVLSESRAEILRMTGKIIPTQPSQEQHYKSYTEEDGTLLTASSLVNPIAASTSFRRGDVVVEIGNQHPIGQALGDLGLAKHALAYQFIPESELILFPGRNMKDI